MKKTKDLRHGFVPGGFALLLALVLFGKAFSEMSFVSRAESQGKVTAQSVNIRKEPSTTSEVVGSTEINKVISIVSQEKGADGNTWYKVYVNATTMGYIRSDLVTITDGTTPPASSGGSSSTGNSSTGTSSGGTPTEPPADTEPPAQVTEVEPVGGTVTGDDVKIYENVSTASQSVAEVENAAALTVVGTATDSAGTTWYKVSLTVNEAPISGFVQSPYVHLTGELVPPGQTPPPTEPEPTAPPQEEKQYETIYVDGEWLLYNTDNPNDGYPIQKLLDNNKAGADLYEQNQKTVKNQKVVIIILVFMLVAAVAGIAFLVFKIRDMMDSAYFNEVENETLRRRSTGGSQGGGQRVMHKVGVEKQGVRSSAARQPGSGQEQRQSASQQRPSGAPQQRPAGASQQRPSGASQQRPSGASQQRPSGASQQRPSGTSQQRPSGTSQQRPSGASQQRPSGTSQQRPAGTPQGARPVQGGGTRPQSKNFMAEDEEFEFEFLNYDGDDEQ